MGETEVWAPVRQGDFAGFQSLTDSEHAGMISLEAKTRYPPKSLFLPQSEVMFRHRGGELKSTEDEASERLIVAIRPCDARGLQ